MKNKGFTLIEVLIAAGILLIAIGGTVSFMTGIYANTRKNQDMVFATQKAIQMFEELRAYVQGNKEDALNNLNNFSDGSSYNHVLTTEIGVTNPADPLSGNILDQGKWRYVRQIRVNPVANDQNARAVSIAVYYADKNINNKPKMGVKALAEIAGILKTNIGPVPPTHVYDVFLLSIQNIPSWWSDQDTLKPIFDYALNDLEGRNPGLEFRRHYITRSAFGRDPYYSPYINTATTANLTDIPFVYYYPGKISPTNVSASTQYYVDENILGRKHNDSGHYFLDITSNNYRKFTLADQFNHAVRYPEEVAIYNRLKGTDEKEISLLMLLEELNKGNNSYKNIILINLHGELLPAPPIRNYSDPAMLLKDSPSDTITDYPNVRVVTHPEKLKYDLVNTTLTSNVSIGSTSVNVSNASGINQDDIIKIGNNLSTDAEIATVNSISGNTIFLDSPLTKPHSNGDSVSSYSVNLRVYSYQTFPQSTPAASRVPEITLFIPTNGNYKLLDPNTNKPIVDIDRATFIPNLSNIVNAISIKKIKGNDKCDYKKYKASPNFTPLTTLSNNTAIGNTFINCASSVNLGIGDNVQIENGINKEITNINSFGINLSSGLTKTHSSGAYIFDSNTTISAAASAASTVITVNSLTNGQGIQIGDYIRISNSDDSNQEFKRVISINPSTKQLTLSAGLASARSVGALVRVVASTLSNSTGIGDTTITLNNSFDISAGNTLTLDTGSKVETVTVASVRLGVAPLLKPHSSGVQVGLAPDYSISVNPTVWTNGTISWANNPLLWTDGSNYFIPGILITLYNTPTQTPNYTLSNRGLPSAHKLYNLEYIPCPVDTNFTKDLTSIADSPKNTARWIVSLDLNQLQEFNNKRIDVETRIGTDLKDGMDNLVPKVSINGIDYDNLDIYRPDEPQTLRSHLKNISRTYIWTGNKDIPEVEKYQILGDPRWEPYMDAKANHNYNWFFYRNTANSTALTGYTNFTRHQGPRWDNDDSDLARLYQLLREGLMNSNGIFNSMTGFSLYYCGIGGEIGGDSSNTLFNIHNQPWNNTDTGSATNSNGDTNTINEITGGTVLPFNITNTWYANPWLGELYPDSAHYFWVQYGNLPTLDSTTSLITDRFYRARYTQSPLGLSNRLKRLKEAGCSTFFNGNGNGSTTTTFNHFYHDGSDASLTKNSGEPGKGLSDAFNLAIPELIKAARPFSLDSTSTIPPEWSQVEYSSVRNTLRYITSTGAESSTPVVSGTNANVYFYKTDEPSKVASSIVKVKRGTNKVCYVVVNGLDRQISGNTGAGWMARYSQSATLQAFMDAGDMSVPGSANGRVVQLPRVEIIEPDVSTLLQNPSNLTIKWTTNWRRWDNKKYSPGYPDNWYDSTPIVFNIKYSTDNGRTWRFVSDNSLTEVGVYDSAHSYTSPLIINTLTERTYNWDVSSLSSGNYLLRVEAYRQGMQQTGYAYHQVLFTIER